MSQSSFPLHPSERRPRPPLGSLPTHCSACFISSGCSWGCLRAEDWAEIEYLRGVIRAAKVGLEIAEKWLTPNVGGWELENDRKEVEYAVARVDECLETVTIRD